MGEKTEANILKAIKGLKGSEGRFKIAVALSYAEPLVEYLKRRLMYLMSSQQEALEDGRIPSETLTYSLHVKKVRL